MLRAGVSFFLLNEDGQSHYQGLNSFIPVLFFTSLCEEMHSAGAWGESGEDLGWNNARLTE